MPLSQIFDKEFDKISFDEKCMKVGNRFVRVHIVVNITLFLHDFIVFVREKSFDGNIKFFLIVRISEEKEERIDLPEEGAFKRKT